MQITDEGAGGGVEVADRPTRKTGGTIVTKEEVEIYNSSEKESKSPKSREAKEQGQRAADMSLHKRFSSFKSFHYFRISFPLSSSP
jgi:hypothetical protein